jgi:putative membrane protein
MMGALWTDWTFEPGTCVALTTLAIAYAIGVRAVWRHAGQGRGIARWRVSCFMLAIVSLVFALLSPLDELSEALFSAHMLQHLILITIAPALLALGMPHIGVLWALPVRARRAFAHWWLGARTIRAVWHMVGAAPIATTLHAAAIWIWHLPGPYQAALRSTPLHALEHVSFLATAILFWWAVIAPRGQRRLGYALGILYVFATAMQSSALGAILTLAQIPWYASQEAGAQLWGLTPLEDQQLAGLIMWVPGGLLYVIAASCLFLAWLSERRPRDTRGPAPTAIDAAAA